MSKIKLGCIPFFIMIGLFSCAQTKPVVNKVYAFKTVQLPGNIQEGEHGNTKVDTTYFVYVEASEQIQWKRAYHDGKCYDIITTPVNENSLVVGKSSNDGKQITIERSKDKILWHLLLHNEIECNNVSNREYNDSFIEGYQNNKKIVQPINEVVLLYKPPTL